MRLISFVLITVFVVCSCNEIIPIPKPRMYPKVDFPARNISPFEKDYCHFTFEYPDYGEVVKDEFFFEEEALDPCWFDLDMKALNADLHCSYTPINKGQNNFDDLIKDAFRLVGEHNSKANFRRESLIENKEEKVHGLLFNIEGPVASPLQFYLTDSTNHFFRASLYFNDKVDPDSTKIILDFIAQDVEHMIETFRWYK